jgi:hypothetical protein
MPLVWKYLNEYAPAVQAVAAIAVVLLTGALVWATRKYVRLTNKIADASAAQTEAMHKPILTLLRDEHASPTSIDLLAGELRNKVASPLAVVNIGAGPALQVKWVIVRPPQGAPIEGFVPYVEAGKSVPTFLSGHVATAGTGIRIQLQCLYESLTKRSKLHVHDDC